MARNAVDGGGAAAEEAWTVTVTDFVEEPEPFVATRTTTFGPAAGNVTVSDCAVVAAIPSPGNQSQLVAWGDEVSVKVTGLPATTGVGNEKLATGGASG